MKFMLFFGSLRKNSKRGYNYNSFGKDTQKYLQDYHLDGFEMYGVAGGAFPAVCEGNGQIKTELHLVSDEAAYCIENMELGAGYTPKKVSVCYNDEKIDATMYVWPKERLIGKTLVKSGDWN